MTESFDSHWLALREPFDTAARDTALALRLGFEQQAVGGGKTRVLHDVGQAADHEQTRALGILQELDGYTAEARAGELLLPIAAFAGGLAAAFVVLRLARRDGITGWGLDGYRPSLNRGRL